jgi:hypothetical protein
MDSDFRPVFLLGLHRSGTTMLSHALQATGCFNAVTPFHLVYRRELSVLIGNRELCRRRRTELQAWFDRHAAVDRGYDEVPVGPDLPEEYGYVLQKRAPAPRLSERNLPLFLDFVRNVHRLDPQRRPVLLKNPWETNNFLEVERLVHRARFIFIHRHPLRVITSQMKMFGALVRSPHPYDMLVDDAYRKLCANRFLFGAARCIYSENLPFLYGRIRKNALLSCRYLAENGDKPAGGVFHVTYDQFCEAPDLWLSRILAFADVAPGKPGNYGPIIRKSNSPLHPFVEREREVLLKLFAPFCHKFSVAL